MRVCVSTQRPTHSFTQRSLAPWSEMLHQSGTEISAKFRKTRFIILRFGMMEMAAGDTDAVVEAFKDRIQCIAAALGEVHQ